MKGIYNIDKFFGGMSNDEFAGSAGMVYDARNVDVGNAKGVILSRSGELFTNKTLVNDRFNGRVVGMITGNFPRICALTQDGRLSFSVGGSFTEVSLPFGNNYRNIGRLNTNTGDYGFILRNNLILRWNYSSSDNFLGAGSDGSNVNTHLTLSTGNFDSKSQYLRNGNILYVTGGSRIYAIDISLSTWVEDNICQIDSDYSITYITEIGDQIIIYANNGQHGKQYFWNGVDQAPDRVIDWYDKPILGGVTLNNIDYVVTGTNFKREFYGVNGYQPQLIYETDVFINKTQKDKYFFTPNLPNTFETIGKTIVIPGISQIYKYGNSKVGLPIGITRDYFNEYNDGSDGNITTLYYQDSFRVALHLFYQDNNGENYLILNQLQGIKNAVRYPTRKPGSIITLRFDNENYSQRKQGEKYRIGYNIPTDITQKTWINVYAKINNQGNFADFYITDSYTTAPEIGAKYSYDGITWEVYNVTKGDFTNGNLVIHCKSEVEYDFTRQDSQFGSLSKVSGNGDSSFFFKDADYGFKLIEKIDGELFRNKNNYTGKFVEEFNEIQFKFDLFSDSQRITPELRDFKLLFNIIQNDLS